MMPLILLHPEARRGGIFGKLGLVLRLFPPFSTPPKHQSSSSWKSAKFGLSGNFLTTSLSSISRLA